jgi:hypothetical protein
MPISTSRFRRVNGLSLITNFSNESIHMIGSILSGLNSTVRKGNNIFTGNNTVTVLGLSLLEVGFAVVLQFLSTHPGIRVWRRVVPEEGFKGRDSGAVSGRH